MFHFWRCLVCAVLVMEAVIGEDGSQSTSTAALTSKLASVASTIATATTQDGAKSAPPALVAKPEIVGRPAPAKDDGQSSRSLLLPSTTLEPGHANEPPVAKGTIKPQPSAGSTAEHAPSTAHEDEGAEFYGREAEDGDVEVQRMNDYDPNMHSTSEFSPRGVAMIGALVSFIGVVSYSFVVLYYVFKGRRGTKSHKPVRKAPEMKQSSQLENLEAAFDMDDWGNDFAPSSIVRKSAQTQQSHEAEEDASGDEGWCNADWSDAQVSEKCQPIVDDILEAAIVAGGNPKPSSTGPPPKGKAD